MREGKMIALTDGKSLHSASTAFFVACRESPLSRSSGRLAAILATSVPGGSELLRRSAQELVPSPPHLLRDSKGHRFRVTHRRAAPEVHEPHSHR